MIKDKRGNSALDLLKVMGDNDIYKMVSKMKIGKYIDLL